MCKHPKRTATQTAVAQNPSERCLELAESLACYTSDEDLLLDRRSFLQAVQTRIESDLAHNTY